MAYDWEEVSDDDTRFDDHPQHAWEEISDMSAAEGEEAPPVARKRKGKVLEADLECLESSDDEELTRE
eukprot:5393101-Amphidinium_carterae.1